MKVLEQYKLTLVDKIKLKYDNSRKIFNDDEMKDLINSVSESGVLNPIWCSFEDNNYYLIAGERRLRASKKLGLKDIPTRIFQVDSVKEALTLQAIENEQRADLSQEEKFNQFQNMKELGMSVADMSKMTGIRSGKIGDILNLENLRKDIFKSKNVGDFAKTQLAKLREDEQLVMAKKLLTKDSQNNPLMTGRRLYDDVVKNLNRLHKDESIDIEVKERIRTVVIEQATKDVQASRIIAREKEKIRIRLEGKMPDIIDNSVVQSYINASDKYYRLLLEMIENKIEIADITLVKKLILSIAGVQEALNELTGRINHD
jgi:ParB family chromosome partitioning protein|tara:strand:- start:810 stop:1757 length:948 start_codon:yes stop_codon:yes gene_type:complete